MPSLPAAAAVGHRGVALALRALLEARDTTQLQRASRAFRGMNAMHLRVVRDRHGRRWKGALGVLRDLRTLELVDCHLSAEDLVVLGDALRTMGALVKFDVSKNRLCAPGARRIAEALNGHQVMTELNISGNRMGWNEYKSEAPDMSGVIAMSNAIRTMSALTRLDISKQVNKHGRGGIGPEGATHIAAALLKCK